MTLGQLSPSRRGLGLVGMLILLLIFVGIGISFSLLARQTGRSSHWYHDSELALDLAECALKEACAEMRDANGTGKASLPPFEELFRLVATGQAGESKTLLSDTPPHPNALAKYLEGPIKEYGPSFDVTVKLTSVQQIAAPGNGIAAFNGERRGVLRLTGRGSVKSSTGIKVERTLVVEKDFMVVSLVPPLIGRFALYALGAPEVDPNFVRMPASGTGQPSGPRPLEIRTGPALPVVKGADLDGNAVSAGADAEVLDKNGWIFLGHGGGGGWDLKLAQGWGDLGESPLIDCYRRRDPSQGNFPDDLASAIRNYGLVAPGAIRAGIDGLWFYDQGFCEDAGMVGVPDEAKSTLGGTKALPVGDDASSSCLRLYGSAPALTPTLVFGPVRHQFVRRAYIMCQLVGRNGDEPFSIYLKDSLGAYQGPDHDILQAAFQPGGGYAVKGPRLVPEAESEVLSHLLDTNPSGTFQSDGIMTISGGSGGVGAAKTYTSKLCPDVGQLPAPPSGVTAAQASAFAGDAVDIKGIYKEDLHKGLSQLVEALAKKVTFTIVSRARADKLVQKDKLRVPGIVHANVDPLVIPRCTVAEGGILINEGTIKITGDITAAPGGKEPLTLISRAGNIEIAGASKVQAYLVAADPEKHVIFGSGAVEIEGGVACGKLDLKSLKQDSSARKITWSKDFDPARGAHVTECLRAYYGGEEKMTLSGSDDR